ncbi:O-antigen ligase family protein (plasmid) [Sphingomonadaceae bacterium OTU29LAMAA1]|nr:O-antigen ligase family protein [Sphingomonadaceae bacterium OTU29LAMAA1]
MDHEGSRWHNPIKFDPSTDRPSFFSVHDSILMAQTFSPRPPVSDIIPRADQAAMPVFLAVVVCALSGFTNIKLADIQSVEVVVLAAMLLSLLMPHRQVNLRAPGPIDAMKMKFVWMFVLIFIGSALSLRLTFYPPYGISAIKQPPFATFARMIQVMLSVSSLFIVALAARQGPDAFRKLLTAYVWCAYVGAIWGIVSMMAHFIGIELPGVIVQSTVRMRGFFIEGGPFGIYLVGAIIIQIIRGPYLGYVSRYSFYAGIALLSVALIGAQSKASALLVVTVMIPYFIRVRRIKTIFLLAVLAMPVIIASGVLQGIGGYYDSMSNFNAAVSERPDDSNLIMGRIAAAILLPRMVLAHPILGIGVGNYSLVRNDPSILQGMPRVEGWDLHGLGLLGYCAELGVPLTIFVMWVYAYPIVAAWRTRPWIVLLGSYPIVAAIYGVQLNFAYPWIVAGLALAAVDIDRDHKSKRAYDLTKSNRSPVPARRR